MVSLRETVTRGLRRVTVTQKLIQDVPTTRSNVSGTLRPTLTSLPGEYGDPRTGDDSNGLRGFGD